MFPFDVGYHTAMESRFVSGSFIERGPAVCWMRMRVPLVDGQPIAPLTRVLVAADSGNGISNILDLREHLFVNPDLSVHLHRYPDGEWVCLQSETSIGARRRRRRHRRCTISCGPIGRVGTEPVHRDPAQVRGLSPVTQMMREISEQPDSLARTLDALLPLRPQVARLADGRRHVLFVARGSSDNAAIYGRYLCEVLGGRQAGLAAPSLATHYRADVDLSDTLTVSVSQSGETAEIAETQAWAKAHGARTIAVTNIEDSTLARAADLALVTAAGAELAVPATKTYTTQLAAIAVLASSLAEQPVALLDAFARVPAEASRLLDDARGPAEDAAAMLDRPPTRSSPDAASRYGTALEVALKLEETCLRPVRGLSYADLQHGPIAVVDAELATVLVAAPDGPTVAGMAQLATTVRERHARVVGIGGDAAFAGQCDIALPGPNLPEALAPLALVIPGQLMVEALARRLGLDPDRPRGLSKVTQTDHNAARSCNDLRVRPQRVARSTRRGHITASTVKSSERTTRSAGPPAIRASPPRCRASAPAPPSAPPRHRPADACCHRVTQRSVQGQRAACDRPAFSQPGHAVAHPDGQPAEQVVTVAHPSGDHRVGDQRDPSGRGRTASPNRPAPGGGGRCRRPVPGRRRCRAGP